MSLTAAAASTTNCVAKVELAALIVDSSPLPRLAIRRVYEAVIESLLEYADISMSEQLAEKVWAQDSSSKVKELKKFFISEYARLILNLFSDVQISQMIAQKKARGDIAGGNGRMLRAYAKLNWPLLIVSLNKKSRDIIKDWIPDILEAASETNGDLGGQD